MLLHVAATISSEGTPSDSQRRIKLLEDALHFATFANHVAPLSLSCAALRATVLLQLLVEHRTTLGTAQNQAALLRQSNQFCQLIQDASGAAKTALGAPQPQEPIITVSAGGLTTYDPDCSVRARMASSPGMLATLMRLVMSMRTHMHDQQPWHAGTHGSSLGCHCSAADTSVWSTSL